MRHEEMPIFGLATTSSYLVIAGGGGDPEYGKPNGVLVMKKAWVDKGEDDRKGVLYKTEQHIRNIYVCKADCSGPRYDCDDSTAGELQEGKTEEYAFSGSKKGPVEEFAEPEIIYILALSEDFLYYLRFGGEFELLVKVGCSVQTAWFERSLFLLTNGNVYGFYDVISNPGSLKIQERQASGGSQDEEFFYRLLRKEDTLVYRNEGGADDIPNNWDNFFIYKGNIHKVVYQSGSSTFVFNGKKHTYSGRISKIAIVGDALVFYILLEGSSMLYFISSSERIFHLPQITSLSTTSSSVAIATSAGDAIVYVDGFFHSKTNLSFLPVTGVSFEGARIYYSTINGRVDCSRVIKHGYGWGFVLAFVVILVGVLIKISMK